MFTENKYTRWYFKIIKSTRAAMQRGYVEEHHTGPTCMGGFNVPKTKVRILARNHFGKTSEHRNMVLRAQEVPRVLNRSMKKGTS